MVTECYQEEVQHYRKTDHKAIMTIILFTISNSSYDSGTMIRNGPFTFLDSIR